MSSLYAAFIVLFGALGFCKAAPQEDLITNLPGLPSPPSFKQYSGYLQALGTRRLHYWFIESSSNPSVDPVVLWMNGGPGCSSLDGLLTEHGPFRVTNSLGLSYNPYSWNQVANMIYLEAPAGVGFSYATDGNYTINDAETAANNHAALKDFFKKFPEFQKNDFYITGESYGGIYVPTLASDVLDDDTINLKGFAVGNGLSDVDLNDNSIIFFAYYHGLLGESQWNKVVNACCPSGVSDGCDFSKTAQSNKKCMNQMESVMSLVWSDGLDPYNLYSTCASSTNSDHYDSTSGKFISYSIMKPFAFLPSRIKEEAFLKSLPREKVVSNIPCINSTLTTNYLNIEAVRSALHIPQQVQKWTVCSAIPYIKQYQTMMPFYKKAMERKMRILVYNGDIDMACNFLGDEWFVDRLEPKDPQPRRFWYYKDPAEGRQIAGFVKAFNGITYLTVKGAGHMVPTDKPIPALEMFINFVQDKPY